MDNPPHDNEPLYSDIVGFEDLFAAKPPEPQKAGLRRRSTLLIAGPPGAGKTTLALALARSLLHRQSELRKAWLKDDLQPKDTNPDCPPKGILYYLSLETDPGALEKIYGPMGWFGSDEERVFVLGDGDAATMHIIAVRPEFDRPVASSEEVANALFARLTASIDSQDRRCVFVIVDSISALARDTGSVLERRRQTFELKARLEAAFQASGSDLTLTMFLAERPAGPSTDKGALVEEYLVDTVFRLDVQEHSMGRRLRTLEIMKSQGVNMIMGEHSWAITTGVVPDPKDQPKSGDFPSLLFERKFFAPAVRAQALSGESDKQGKQWGTVVILPRSRATGARPEKEVKQDAGIPPSPPLPLPQHIRSGTTGLDHMLNAKDGHRYWHSATATANGCKGLATGSISLLVGPPGTGKSTMLMQFLFAAWYERSRAIYVTFDQKKQEADLALQRHWESFRKIIKDSNPPDKPPVVVYAIPHSQVDINLVLAQLRRVIWEMRKSQDQTEEGGASSLTRIAMDGLSEWLSACNKGEESGPLALESLLNSLKDEGHSPVQVSASWVAQLAKDEQKAGNPSQPAEGKTTGPGVTMLLAYETRIGEQVLPEDIIGVPAQNILALRHVHLAEATRRMIYVVKSAGQDSDPNPREVVFNRRDECPQVEIRPGFDEYAGLVKGRPGKATAVLQLFGENDYLKAWNLALMERLKEIRDLDYKALNFHSTEIARTLEETENPGHFPPSDLKIMEVDEWWIAHPTRTGDNTSAHPLLPLTDQWRPQAGRAELGSWREYWFGELDKAIVQDPTGKKELHAIPGYMDFGMVCFNVGALAALRALPAPPAATAGTSWWSALPAEEAAESRADAKAISECEPPSDAEMPKSADARASRARKWKKEHQGAARRLWMEAQLHLPRRWLPAEIAELMQEKPPAALFEKLSALALGAGVPGGSMIELGAWMRNRVKNGTDPALPQWLFTYDTSSPETHVCLFFELTWACGGSEDFLEQEAHDYKDGGEKWAPTGKYPSVHALFLMQYLVMAGLMPSGADPKTAGHSLFSRQWQSTLMSAGVALPLMAVPFWPVAAAPAKAFDAALRDAEIRFSRFMLRLDDSLKAAEKCFEDSSIAQFSLQHQSILGECRKAIAGTGLLKYAKSLEMGTPLTAVAIRLKNLHAHTTDMAPLFAAGPERNSFRLVLNAAIPRRTDGKDVNAKDDPVAGFVDLSEMWTLHCLRLWTLLTEASGGTLSDALTGWKANPLPPEAMRDDALARLQKKESLRGHALVGNTASGSWMYAVHRSSRSVTLARDLIQELTSTRSVQERAITGAGIPARKDFYQTWGEERVPSAEHLTWREMMRYNLAHTRRRDRVLSRAINAAEIYKLIREMTVRCLEFADLHRIDDAANSAANLRQAWNLAEQAVSEILRTIRNRMEAAGQLPLPFASSGASTSSSAHNPSSPK